jgi:lambda family phage portal protein
MGLRTRLAQAFGFGTPEPAPEPRKVRRRSYMGARLTRLTADWLAGQTSADAEIKTSLRKLRDRSRQMVRDNPYARQAKRAVQMNVIGHGIQLQAHVMKLRGNKRDDVVNEAIEKAWTRWTAKDACDVSGKLSFHQMELLAAGALPESGDVFFRIVRRPFGRSRVPLALQILEADLLDDEYSGPVSTRNGEWRMGVEVNEWGRPVRYAFFTRHPGDSGFVGTQRENRQHTFIPADDVIHLFLPERPGQTRGVPWFAPVMDDAHQMEGYEQAAVIRARGAASLMGFIETPEGELLGDDVDGEQRLTDFEPGQFRYLNPGEKIEIPQLNAPDSQYQDFVRQKTRRFAAGFGCSYETISRDFSQTNYSSSRLSLLEDREHWKLIQRLMIETLHQRVFSEWLGAAVLAGELNLGDYELRPERYEGAIHWQARGWSWVDPLKEAKAYALMEDRGYMTKAQICGLLGSDMEENMKELAFEQQLAMDLGVTLTGNGDSDNGMTVDANTDETQ